MGEQPPAEAATAIQVKGSDTLLQLGQKWAEVYQQSHSEVQIAVTGGGSGTGIAALIDGNCDIANASRQMKDEETKTAQEAGVNPRQYVVAYDGIAVIVNKQNQLEQLTMPQLSDIFAGRMKSWKEVGGEDAEIVLLIRDTASGTHVYFKEAVVNQGSKLGLEYAAEALPQVSNQAIHDVVMQNAQAIGYIGLGYLDDAVKAVKVVGEEGGAGVTPSIASVKDGSYPISRALYNYTNGEPSGHVRDYLSWCLGNEGQAIVEEIGFVPGETVSEG
jgi:phosphate transport system substrate-binding protein